MRGNFFCFQVISVDLDVSTSILERFRKCYCFEIFRGDNYCSKLQFHRVSARYGSNFLAHGIKSNCANFYRVTSKRLPFHSFISIFALIIGPYMTNISSRLPIGLQKYAAVPKNSKIMTSK